MITRDELVVMAGIVMIAVAAWMQYGIAGLLAYVGILLVAIGVWWAAQTANMSKPK